MDDRVFRSVFERQNLRLSVPRLLIYQELGRSLGPLTPQQLHRNLLKRRRKIGLTSIYRTLELFESLGIAFKVVRGGHSTYQLCAMANHHHHIVCRLCGRVVEFEFCDISGWSKKLSESTGYEVTEHELVFYGVCAACRSRA